MTATDWHSVLRARSGEPVSAAPSPVPFQIVAFDDLPTDIVQPPLLDDILVLHTAGPKQVHRLRDGRRTAHDIDPGTLTLLQRGRPASWQVQGPIGHMQLVLNPRLLDEMIEEECGCSRSDISFIDTVGFASPILAQVLREMLWVRDVGDESRFYAEALQSVAIQALLRHGRERPATPDSERTAWRGGLPGWRLRRVLDYMTEHRAADIDYATVVSLSGVSRAQFYRAFRQSTGTTPARYLQQLRVERARRLIEAGLPLPEVAAAAGFGSPTAMARAFRRCVNVTPDLYRRWCT